MIEMVRMPYWIIFMGALLVSNLIVFGYYFIFKETSLDKLPDKGGMIVIHRGEPNERT